MKSRKLLNTLSRYAIFSRNLPLHFSRTYSQNYYSVARQYMSHNEILLKSGKVKLTTPLNPVHSGMFPDIVLPSTTGERISIAEVAKNHNVILFYYPGDKEGLKYPELSGCTPQACNFRNAVNTLAELNTLVFGINFHTNERQSRFILTSHLNFPLLSDADRTLAKALNLAYWQTTQGEYYPSRQTYLITKGNNIAKVFVDVNPHNHINEVHDEIIKLTLQPRLK